MILGDGVQGLRAECQDAVLPDIAPAEGVRSWRWREQACSIWNSGLQNANDGRVPLRSS
jgi:hypothetical protein